MKRGQASSAPPDAAGAGAPAEGGLGRGGRGNMLPGRQRRTLGIERFFMRLIATLGIIGVGVLLGAILGSAKVSGWITGLVISVVSVILAAVLWSSRQL